MKPRESRTGSADCSQGTGAPEKSAVEVQSVSRICDTLLANRTAGIALPGEAYSDGSLYRHELERIFFSNWLFAGHSCEIPNPGDFRVVDVADESIILIRGEEGSVHAHANVCRHRGSRICTETSGHARRLVCPYHQWSYRTDGTLASAAWMGDDFDPANYPLHAVHVRNVGGLIYICLANEPPEFTSALEAIEPQIRLNQLDRARVCGRFDYTIDANWKLVVENNRECYHCRGSHPEFCRSNYDVGINGDRRDDHHYRQALERQSHDWERLGLNPRDVSFPDGAWYRVARFPLKDGFLSESLDGATVAPLMGAISEARTGSLRIVTLPNAWIHVNCDYAVTSRVIPDGPGRTRAQVTFLVDGDAIPGVDFDADNVAAVWKATSEQDWELCEQTQKGVNSRFYVPGPYSPFAEISVRTFIDWYLTQITAR